MKTYKNLNSFVKAIKHLADNQTVQDLRGYDSLPEDAKLELGALIADIQNGIHDYENILSVPSHETPKVRINKGSGNVCLNTSCEFQFEGNCELMGYGDCGAVKT